MASLQSFIQSLVCKYRNLVKQGSLHKSIIQQIYYSCLQNVVKRNDTQVVSAFCLLWKHHVVFYILMRPPAECGKHKFMIIFTCRFDREICNMNRDIALLKTADTCTIFNADVKILNELNIIKSESVLLTSSNWKYFAISNHENQQSFIKKSATRRNVWLNRCRIECTAGAERFASFNKVLMCCFAGY